MNYLQFLRRSQAVRAAQMFASGEQGVWYDPSDMSTLFQDSAGTVPVTAVEQPVGRILDKSGRGNHATQATTTKRPVLSRRVNLLTKTENFSDAAWRSNLFGNWSINNARSAAAAPSPRGDFTATTIAFTAPQSSMGVGQRVAVSPGVYRAALWMRLTPGVSSLGSAFMFIGVVNGNSNAFVAPYSNIQNIGPQLSEDWKMFTIEHTVPSSGVNQVELLINKQASSETCSVDVWGASLTLAADAHLPYQRINTDTDYDADPAKFPAYLRFDGVDDALQTGNIDFTGTDKMTVWAGVTKLSDAAPGYVVNQNAAFASSFRIMAPAGASSNTYQFGAGGGTVATPAIFGVAAPHAAVLSAAADIAGNTARIKVNSSVASAVGLGSGSFTSAPIFVGSRSDNIQFFNGRLYSLSVRGAQSSLSQIEAGELYTKQKMRLP